MSAFCLCRQLKSATSAGSIKPFKDSGVQTDWILNMLVGHKIRSEVARAEGVKSVQNQPTVLLIIDLHACEALALA